MFIAVEGFLSDRIFVPAVGLFDGTAEKKNPKEGFFLLTILLPKPFFK